MAIKKGQNKANCKAIFPGTFDPPTLGHLDIITRAASIVDKLYIAIAVNLSKPTKYFEVEEKKAMLREMTVKIPNVEIISFEGLVAEFAKRNGFDFIVRGLRNVSDMEYEFQMSVSNKKMEKVETLFLMSDPQYVHICSSLIHEIACFGHRLHGFVPEAIEDAVYMRIASKHEALRV